MGWFSDKRRIGIVHVQDFAGQGVIVFGTVTGWGVGKNILPETGGLSQFDVAADAGLKKGCLGPG